MGRPFRLVSEGGADRPSVVRRRARTGQSPDPRAADRCPVGPRAAPSGAPRSSPGVVRSLGKFLLVQFAGRPLEHDVSPGGWIAPVLRPVDEHVVGSLVPPV